MEVDERLIDAMQANIENNRCDIESLQNCTKYDDAYWLRSFAGSILQGILAAGDELKENGCKAIAILADKQLAAIKEFEKWKAEKK